MENEEEIILDPDEEGEEQQKNSKVPKQLQSWQYKKGQSGNPGGRPIGSVSMKTYIKNKLLSMTDEEREEFLEGVDKKAIWEMAEGKPKQDTDITSGGEPIVTLIKYDKPTDSVTP